MNRARLLRKKATEPERILWRHLRNRNFAGYKFRRQHPLDSYVIDFYCPAAKLAIELDGGGHNYRSGRIRDRSRSELLASHGIIVLRFWNHQGLPGTRRCLESNLVCARGAVPAKTLTLILSLWQRERRALGLDRLQDTCAQNRSTLKARFRPPRIRSNARLNALSALVTCQFEFLGRCPKLNMKPGLWRYTSLLLFLEFGD